TTSWPARTRPEATMSQVAPASMKPWTSTTVSPLGGADSSRKRCTQRRRPLTRWKPEAVIIPRVISRFLRRGEGGCVPEHLVGVQPRVDVRVELGDLAAPVDEEAHPRIHPQPGRDPEGGGPGMPRVGDDGEGEPLLLGELLVRLLLVGGDAE